MEMAHFWCSEDLTEARKASFFLFIYFKFYLLNKLRASTIRVNRMGQYVWNLDGYLLGKKEVDNLKPFREPFETGLQRIYISLYFPSLSTKKKKKSFVWWWFGRFGRFWLFCWFDLYKPKKKNARQGFIYHFPWEEAVLGYTREGSILKSGWLLAYFLQTFLFFLGRFWFSLFWFIIIYNDLW